MARCRPVGTRVHSAPVFLCLRRSRHHGDADDRGPQGPADHDPDCAADDLFCALPVYAVIIGAFIPATQRWPGHRPARAGPVRPLYRGNYRARCSPRLSSAARLPKGHGLGFMMEMPKYQLPHLKDLAAWPLAARRRLPEARGNDHCADHHRPLGGCSAFRRLIRRAAVKPDRPFSRGTHRRWAGADRGTHWLQPRHCVGADPGDGGARSRGFRAGHHLCH